MNETIPHAVSLPLNVFAAAAVVGDDPVVAGALPAGAVVALAPLAGAVVAAVPPLGAVVAAAAGAFVAAGGAVVGLLPEPQAVSTAPTVADAESAAIPLRNERRSDVRCIIAVRLPDLRDGTHMPCSLRDCPTL